MYFYPSIIYSSFLSNLLSIMCLSHNHILLITPITFSILFPLYVESTPNIKSEETKTRVLLKFGSLNHREQLRLQEESKNPRNNNPSFIHRTKEPLPTVDELSPVNTICRLFTQIDTGMWSSTLQHTETINSP